MSLRLTEAQARTMGLDIPKSGAKTLRGKTLKPEAPRFSAIGSKRRKGGRKLLPEAADFHFACSIPIEPRTKQRPRASVSTEAIMQAYARTAGDPSAFRRELEKICPRVYTDAETRAYETNLAMLARMAMRGRDPVQTPVRVHVGFHLTGDVSTMPTDVTDPDIDNLVKATFDALNGIVYRDDRLACWKTISKECAATPRIDIVVEAVSLSTRPDTDYLSTRPRTAHCDAS